jgi:NADH-quinone oxidoreductase subunit F
VTERAPDRGPAHARGVASFFADLHADPRALRVCRGTSCELAGAAALHEELARRGPCRTVYCVGYCHRSPAVLLPDGRVATGADAWSGEAGAAPEEPLPRCLARAPVVTERIGRGDFARLAAARAAGAWEALPLALERGAAWVLDTLERSGERGRGGGGFPTAAKWRRGAAQPAPRRFAVANGDEGDPGSFVDRVLLERDPHAVLEGLALAALAVGAERGIVYVRSEYPEARERVARAAAEARAAGVLDGAAFGRRFPFEVEVVSGRGSYVCGEETALLAALEGRRGEVRPRPPYPSERGLFGLPTVVNNVETLVNVPWILRRGAEAYRALGAPSEPGTKALSLGRGFARPGIVEVEFGTPLRRVIEEGGGGRDGVELEAVALGGPMGCIVPRSAWDVPLSGAALAARGLDLGHGGLVAIPRGTDRRALLRHWLRFMADESCGRCVPCRVGSRRALELAGDLEAPAARERLARLLELVATTSLCPFGQRIPGPARGLLAGPEGAR